MHGQKIVARISVSPENNFFSFIFFKFINQKKAGLAKNAAPAFFLLGSLVFFGGCSVIATRPVQEMAIADAALRAAREVNGDILEGTKAPEYYRAAADALLKARREFRTKNFELAKKYANRAATLAERSEFEAIKAGGATPEATTARWTSGTEGAPPDMALGLDQSIQTELKEPPKDYVAQPQANAFQVSGNINEPQTGAPPLGTTAPTDPLTQALPPVTSEPSPDAALGKNPFIPQSVTPLPTPAQQLQAEAEGEFEDEVTAEAQAQGPKPASATPSAPGTTPTSPGNPPTISVPPPSTDGF